MPRDSQGNYTLPPGTLVATGDTILVSQHNPAMADLQQAVGNSLDRNGAGAMRAPLQMGGNPIKNIAPGVDPGDAVTMAQIGGGGGGVPTGTVLDYAGATAPAGWLMCGGQSLARADYPDLFAVLGTAFGSTSASTFNLPDLRGRVSAGADFSNGGVSDRLNSVGADRGAVGGAQFITLTEAQLAAHTHPLSGSTSAAGDHTHSYNAPSQFGGSDGGGSPGGYLDSGTTGPAGSHTHTLTGTVGSAGGGQAHSNVQPTIVLNKIIRTGVN